LTLSIDEEIFTMPQSVLTWENHNLRLVTPDQDGYVFKGWANGVEISQEGTILVPPSSANIPEYIAVFEKVGDSESSTEPPVSSPTEDVPSDTVPTEDDQVDTGSATDAAPKEADTTGPTSSPVDPPPDPVATSDETESGDVTIGDNSGGSRAVFSSFFVLLLSLSLFHFGQ